MKNKYLFSLFLFLVFSIKSYGQKENNKPNVILITSDQMRGDNLGILGHPNVCTPHLDEMAEDGVIFSNFFSNSPVCAPSRVSIFSGLLPHQHGKLTNRSGEFLHQKEGTILGYFKKLGYRLGWIGKDHHTYKRSVMNSLDKNVSRAREPFRGYTRYVPPYWYGDMYWPVDQLHATKNTQDAIDFINNNSERNQPFFLNINYFDPHPPYFAPAEYVNNYDLEAIEIPYYIPPENLEERLAEQQKALHYDKIKETFLKQALRYYYASIEWGVDHQVGRILKTLKRKGIEKNTVVIFTSDHGDFMGTHHMVRKGMFLYDALLHVPFIVYAPGQIQEGAKIEFMASGIDIYPTLIDLNGGEIPSDLPGKSLVPALKGKSMPRNPEHYTVFASAAYSDLPEGYFKNPEPPHYNPPEDNNTPFHTRVQRLTWRANQKTIMARTKDWKLIINESRPPELYKMNGKWVENENITYKEEYQEIYMNLKNQISKVWNWVKDR